MSKQEHVLMCVAQDVELEFYVFMKSAARVQNVLMMFDTVIVKME